MERWVNWTLTSALGLLVAACSGDEGPQGGGLETSGGMAGTTAGSAGTGIPLPIGGAAGSSGSGGAGGTAGSGIVAAGSGGAGSGGTSGSSSGSGGSGTGGGGTGGGSGCESEKLVCNGMCLEVGETGAGCTVLARGLDYYSLALDAEYVYAADSSNILRFPRAGGAGEPIVAVEAGPQSLAVNDTFVYWSGSTDDGTAAYRAPKAGGSPELLAASELTINNVVAVPGRVFYVERDELATAEIRSIGEPNESPVVHGTTGFPYDSIAADEMYVYWNDSVPLEGAAIRRSPHAGGTAETLSSDETAYHPVLNGDFVYYYQSYSNYLRRVNKAGGTPAENVVSIMPRAVNSFLFGNDSAVFFPSEEGLSAVGFDGMNERVVVELDRSATIGEADTTTVYLAVSSFLIAAAL